MKAKYLTSVAGLTVLITLTSFSALAQTATDSSSSAANLYAKGQTATAANFTGTVWVNMLVDPKAGVDCAMGSVTFEPGARTNWHTHSNGQVLLVMEGTGYYQEKGKLVKTIRRGDVVACRPDVQHWHGASPGSSMIHIATVPNASKPNSTVWLGKVTDAEYMGQQEK